MSKKAYSEMVENLANIKGISKNEAAVIIIKAVKDFNAQIKK